MGSPILAGTSIIQPLDEGDIGINTETQSNLSEILRIIKQFAGPKTALPTFLR